jgi:hypothetical protein
MGAFTDMLLPDKGSGEETEKLEDSDEGEPIPGTARHREYYPEGIAEVLEVRSPFEILWPKYNNLTGVVSLAMLSAVIAWFGRF